jgi:hypothetical protein
MQHKSAPYIFIGQVDEGEVQDEQKEGKVIAAKQSSQNQRNTDDTAVDQLVGNEEDADSQCSEESANSHAEVADDLVEDFLGQWRLWHNLEDKDGIVFVQEN